jgi:23S rRNA pseudouridine955/2504/2580 synthase
MSGDTRIQGPQQITVERDDAGRRLDNFLLTRLKGVPRSRVYRMIRGGEVRVNKKRARPQLRLASGDQVRIPPFHGAARRGLPRPAARDLGWIERRVVYEDRDQLVLNKPSGLAVHGGSGISHGAIELLRAARGKEQSLELVHRLDRETSGCLLIAKRRSSLRHLHALFRGGQVDKRYLALLVGPWAEGARSVKVPLTTDYRRGGERHVRVDAAGKKAVTHFTPLRRFPQSVLCSVRIETGRTHQIRVHAAYIDHPVAGDERYGATDDSIVQRYGLKRLFLHAASLAFASSAEDRLIRVDCPLDDELEALLARLAEDLRQDD